MRIQNAIAKARDPVYARYGKESTDPFAVSIHSILNSIKMWTTTKVPASATNTDKQKKETQNLLIEVQEELFLNLIEVIDTIFNDINLKDEEKKEHLKELKFMLDAIIELKLNAENQIIGLNQFQTTLQNYNTFLISDYETRVTFSERCAKAIANFFLVTLGFLLGLTLGAAIVAVPAAIVGGVFGLMVGCSLTPIQPGVGFIFAGISGIIGAVFGAFIGGRAGAQIANKMGKNFFRPLERLNTEAQGMIGKLQEKQGHDDKPRAADGEEPRIQTL